ncbi:MAG TPA: Hsp20/alpha crystallin family protein [Gemmataceae bacterium]|jgi:HSP20 family protein|nr:Hsp20/alpha crystallin family protein [Gemmataceae bacterium]
MAEMTSVPQKGRAEAAAPESTRGGNYYTPQVDICETDRELILYADLPGVKPEDVDLRYERGELLLHGRVSRRPAAGSPFLLQEYGTGDFYRVFSIHESIDSSKISAECKNGVLTVHLPKMEALQPRQIQVRGT